MTVRFRHLVAFALPSVPQAVVIFPSQAILPGFYAQHTGIPLATIGLVLIFARAFDAVTDPLVGFLSDRTIDRLGTRKPWMIAGALVLSVAVVNLYAPAPDTGAAEYLAWFLAFYFGYTLIDIPHKAWGTELARGYVDRSRIFTSLAVAFGVGNLAFALAPFLAASGSGAYDAETLDAIGWAVAIALPVTVLAAVLGVPDGAPTRAKRIEVRAVLRAMRSNLPLLRFLATYLLTGLGQGIFYGLVFLFVGSVLGLGEKFAWVLLADAAVTLVSVPLWYRLIRLMQKHRAWALGLGISVAALLAMLWLPEGEAAFLPLIVLVCVRAFGSCVTQVAPNALLGDVVDYELMKRQVNQAANFHAMVSLATKFTVTAGSGAGLLAVGLAGFDPKVANSEAVITAFKVAALLVPALILLGGAVSAVGFPLHRRRHDIVRRRLESRMADGG